MLEWEQMSKKNILFINGISDSNKLTINSIDKNGEIQWKGSGSANLFDFLEIEQFNKSIVVFDTSSQNNIPKQTINSVFNQIADPDTHKITLGKVEDFYKKVSPYVSFFNPPSLIMQTTRDNISKMLQGIDKLNVPKTVKIQPRSPSDIYATIKKEEFSYPLIFRQAGDHGGVSTLKVDNETEQFYAFALDGRDYYLTQYVDCSHDGIYSKYRLVIVDGEVFIRHAIFSDSWIIHSNSRQYMKKNIQYEELESDILNSFDNTIKPKIKEVIQEIYHRLQLDYFGIDCNIDKDMNILVFEINANMNVLINNASNSDNPWTKQIDQIKQAIVKMIMKDKK